MRLITCTRLAPPHHRQARMSDYCQRSCCCLSAKTHPLCPVRTPGAGPWGSGYWLWKMPRQECMSVCACFVCACLVYPEFSLHNLVPFRHEHLLLYALLVLYKLSVCLVICAVLPYMCVVLAYMCVYVWSPTSVGVCGCVCTIGPLCICSQTSVSL